MRRPIRKCDCCGRKRAANPSGLCDGCNALIAWYLGSLQFRLLLAFMTNANAPDEIRRLGENFRTLIDSAIKE